MIGVWNKQLKDIWGYCLKKDFRNFNLLDLTGTIMKMNWIRWVLIGKETIQKESAGRPAIAERRLNGKTLMKINKAEAVILNGLYIGPTTKTVANRFNGEQVLLCAEALALHDFIFNAEMTLMLLSKSIDWKNKRDVKIYDKEEKRFFTAKEVFFKNWPKEYMILID